MNPELNRLVADPDTLLIILRVPSQPSFLLLLPDNNFIGTRILARLLDLRLETDGQLIAPANFSGPLNSCVLVFGVRGVHESARVASLVLEESMLHKYAQIYRWDESELICRSLFPAKGQDIKINNIQLKIQSAGTQLDLIHRQIAEFLKLSE